MSERREGKRIVLATFGSLGDLHPYMGVALELKRRGQQAVIATTKEYRERIERAGLEFSAVRPELADVGRQQDVMAKIFDLRRGPEFMIRSVMMPYLKASYEDLTAAAQGADLLVSHPLTFAAPLVAERAGIRWAGSVLSPLSLFSAYDPPALPAIPGVTRFRRCGPRLFRLLFRLMKGLTRSWVEPVRELRREIGLPPSRLDPMYEGQFSPILNLALFSPVFAAPQPDWPGNMVATGFPEYDGADEAVLAIDLAAFLDAGPAPIVFTLGSSAVMNAGRFFAESATAASILGCRAVLLTGRDPRNMPAGRLPEGVAAFEYAPYSSLFPRAAAIVHQGGIGTTARALRSGAPEVVAPFGFDQPDNGQRLSRLGVAKVIPRSRYQATRVAEALGKLISNPDVSRRAQTLAKQMQLENGAAMACDQIERVLG